MTSTLRTLSRDECLERLRSRPVGRIAVTSRAMPAIVPVNFRVIGSTVVFRTERDGMLARACDGTVVAFQVDDLDLTGLNGWCVLIVGAAHLVDGSAALRAVEAGLVTAAGGERDQFVAITIGEISGRDIARAGVMARS